MRRLLAAWPDAPHGQCWVVLTQAPRDAAGVRAFEVESRHERLSRARAALRRRPPAALPAPVAHHASRSA